MHIHDFINKVELCILLYKCHTIGIILQLVFFTQYGFLTLSILLHIAKACQRLQQGLSSLPFDAILAR